MDDQQRFVMKPIGYIKCPRLLTKDDYFGKKKGQVFPAEAIINPEFTEALKETETFDHLWLIWVFNRNIEEGFKLIAHPPAYPDNARPLFVTRSPYRPNPIGLSCVKVMGREENVLKFENSDILDGTPILDIKPYIPSSDSHPDSHAGWISDVKNTEQDNKD